SSASLHLAPEARQAGRRDERMAGRGEEQLTPLKRLSVLGTHELAGDATLRQRTRRHRPLRDRTTTSRSRPGMGRRAGGAWSSNKVLVVRGRPRGTLPPSGAVPTIPRARRGSSSERTHLENCRRTWSSPPAPPPDTFRPAASSL